MSDDDQPGLDPDAAIRRLRRPAEPAGDSDVPGQPAAGDPGAGGGSAIHDPDASAQTAGLDPDAAVGERVRGERPLRPPPPVIDTRRYQRMIGGFGLLLVLAFSLFLFVRGGNGTPGIPVGQRLHRFVAPLATSNLDASANGHPVCNPARPAVRGLNVCGRTPIVLAFFTLGEKGCINQVDAMQAISGEFPHVEFAAVAIGGSRTSTAKVVRQHHWTIPVAYDSADVVGQIYGIEVCPLAEIGTSHDRVAAELIGKYWSSAGHLAGEVRKLGLAQ